MKTKALDLKQHKKGYIYMPNTNDKVNYQASIIHYTTHVSKFILSIQCETNIINLRKLHNRRKEP